MNGTPTGRIPIIFDPELRARIDAFAAETERTVSGAVRHLCRVALDDHDRRKSARQLADHPDWPKTNTSGDNPTQ